MRIGKGILATLFVLVLVGIPLLQGCDGGGGDDKTPSIAGTWNGNITTLGQAIPVVVVFNADGTFTVTGTYLGRTMTFTGNYTLDGDDITATMGGTISGITFTLNMTGTVADSTITGTFTSNTGLTGTIALTKA